MTTVTLHGELAKAMGRAVWELEIQQPREAIAAIEANTGALYAYLSRRHDESQGAVQYRVLVDGRDIGGPDPNQPTPDFYLVGVYVRIDIMPVLAGADGLWQTIVGVVLIVVGVILFFTPLNALAPFVVMAGISMTVAGVAQLLSPSPKLGAGSTPFARTFLPHDETNGGKKEGPEATASYLFSGAVNTTQQGVPVPVCYGGPIVVGSALLSLSITSASVSADLVGGRKPPGKANPFFDLPVWERLQNDPRRNLVKSQKWVKTAKVVDVKTVMAPGLGLPAVYPESMGKAGQAIPVGNGTMPLKSLRGYLSTLAYLFSGDPRPIKWGEAKELFRVLEVDPAANLQSMKWNDLILRLALFYSPDTDA